MCELLERILAIVQLHLHDSQPDARHNYTVRLHFAEIYWTAAGQRVFNVSINGSQVLSNFDIFGTAGGKDIAVVKQFITLANSSGKIIIHFTTVKDNAKISGIEILAN